MRRRIFIKTSENRDQYQILFNAIFTMKKLSSMVPLKANLHTHRILLTSD